jgi:hypothetical protein
MEAALGLQYHLDSAMDFLGPWWVEVCFIICFAFGYRFICLDAFGGKEGVLGKKHAGKLLGSTKASTKADVHKKIKEHVGAGDMIGALKAWRKAQAHVASSPDTLRLIVQALCSESVDTLVEEVETHLETHLRQLATRNPPSPSSMQWATASPRSFRTRFGTCCGTASPSR